MRYSVTNHTNADVFTWAEGEDGMMRRVRYISVDAFKGREFPASWLTPMTMVPWEGLQLPAPADPAAFCAHRYGPSWAKPLAANNDGVAR